MSIFLRSHDFVHEEGRGSSSLLFYNIIDSLHINHSSRFHWLSPPPSATHSWIIFILLYFQLHSEYRSTYRWHEYTGGSRAEVIKKPPTFNQFGNFEFIFIAWFCIGWWRIFVLIDRCECFRSGMTTQTINTLHTIGFRFRSQSTRLYFYIRSIRVNVVCIVNFNIVETIWIRTIASTADHFFSKSTEEERHVEGDLISLIWQLFSSSIKNQQTNKTYWRIESSKMNP